MDDVDSFLHEVLPALTDADIAFHNGDAEPRSTVWSHRSPVTLFGAAFSGSGWDEVSAVFSQVAARFSDCESFTYEPLAAGVSGDLGYIAGFEQTRTSVAGGPAETYRLRVTTIFRREEDGWKVVHRHADLVPDDASYARQLTRLHDAAPSAGDTA